MIYTVTNSQQRQQPSHHRAKCHNRKERCVERVGNQSYIFCISQLCKGGESLIVNKKNRSIALYQYQRGGRLRSYIVLSSSCSNDADVPFWVKISFNSRELKLKLVRDKMPGSFKADFPVRR